MDLESQANLLMIKVSNTKWFMIIEIGGKKNLGLQIFTQIIWNDESRNNKESCIIDMICSSMQAQFVS